MMVARVGGVFDEDLAETIATSKILVVGAGGIGCEILKNLVLTGFPQIEIIDLDTIDVSNLNRQFLFHKEHVGRSKARVARDSALAFNPLVSIVAHHDSVISNDYDVSFFKQFSVVMNALDNRVARNHVNRMCLAADVPLLETGTAGYAGQVELIKKGVTQCYECQPKAPQKTFPGCTIRNTPSEPIHCIVWAKHLFNQLFGEEDPDQDVSPDTASRDGGVQRASTRQWAADTGYDARKLFAKLFGDDIRYLLSMENLWRSRRAPSPLPWPSPPAGGSPAGAALGGGLPDQRVLGAAELCALLEGAVHALAGRARGEGTLVWDKDERAAMDFVCAAANLRAIAFHIPVKSRFEIKSMAGNIIPAIATANAIVAGLAGLRALSVLRGRLQGCGSVYLRPKLNHRQQLFVPEKVLTPPNPQCYVCAPRREVALVCDVRALTLRELDAALRGGLHMQAPDATLEGAGVVLLSSEPGETAHNDDKTLAELGLRHQSALIVDDFLQNYEVRVRLQQDDAERSWRLVTHGDPPAPTPTSDPTPAPANNGGAGPSTSRRRDSDSDLEIVDDDEDEERPVKRRRTDHTTEVVDLS